MASSEGLFEISMRADSQFFGREEGGAGWPSDSRISRFAQVKPCHLPARERAQFFSLTKEGSPVGGKGSLQSEGCRRRERALENWGCLPSF